MEKLETKYFVKPLTKAYGEKIYVDESEIATLKKTHKMTIDDAEVDVAVFREDLVHIVTLLV